MTTELLGVTGAFGVDEDLLAELTGVEECFSSSVQVVEVEWTAELLGETGATGVDEDLTAEELGVS